MLGTGFYNADCMEHMSEYPDNHFDLAIVDPPYGDGGVHGKERTSQDSVAGSTSTRINRGGAQTRGSDGKWRYPDWRYMGGEVPKKIIAWDIAPDEQYFKELFRISRNQIIWGGNYFNLPPTRCFIVWRKLSISENFSMAMAEYAWTSFNDNAKVFEHTPQGDVKDPRFHPTQKPVALYKWLLSNYAKEGDLILDTHVGSASSLIACEQMGFDYVGFEIDEDYYKKATDRLERYKAQVNIYDILGAAE